MRAYFATISKVSDATGNTVDAHGDAAEGFLAVLEKMDIAFGEDGEPALAMIVSPADADGVQVQMDAMPAEQQRRLVEIVNRKREAYLVSRRRRRLPRHGQ